MTPPRPSSRARAAERSGRRRRVLVTAGPTREHVDPVRFLSNESSGRMGFAIADQAARAGYAVTLVTGPVQLETPRGVRRIDVESAREMLAAARKEFRSSDVLFMAAAVADWRPARKLAGKWRAKDSGRASARLDLVKNPDILATLARAKGRRLVVGFALETADGIRRAMRKMKRKRADFVVLNDESSLNADRTSVIILGSDGSRVQLRDRTKASVAKALVALIRE